MRRARSGAGSDGRGRGRESERGGGRGGRSGCPGPARPRGGGRRGGRARPSFRGARGDAHAEGRAPRRGRGHRRALVPDRRAARRSIPPSRASSATRSSALRWSARPGAARSCTGFCTCSATTTARRWSSTRLDGADDAPQGPDPARELQLRVRGDHPRAPHAAEHAHPLPRGGGRPGRGALDGRHQDGADRTAARDRVRLHHRDDQLGPRAGDRRRDDLVRPAREAGQGHRRGRRPDRDHQRDRGRLSRLLRTGLRQQLAPPGPARATRRPS